MGRSATSTSIAERSRRPRTWMLVLAAVVVVGALGLFISTRISVDDYAITPGSATPLSPKVSFSPAVKVPKGDVSMVDVNLAQLSYFGLLWADLTGGPTHYTGQQFGFDQHGGLATYIDQSYLDMARAKNDAIIAAFTSQHQSFTTRSQGVLVYDRRAGSALHLGDLIEAVAGQPVTTACDAANALSGRTGSVELTVAPAKINERNGEVNFGTTKQVMARSNFPPLSVVQPDGSPCPGDPKNRLGITQLVATIIPATIPMVTIDSRGIGGPSAGLAMTLSIADRLSGGAILRGRSIAATGTIDAEGNVGDVGGVAQKTVAVSNAGLNVFLVPREELSVAKGAAPASLKVIAVSTLDEALQALRQLENKP